MAKQKGFSIVECLLAIAFATALIWQVFVIYKDMHQTHQIQAAMSRLLHHGQWFEDVLGQEIRSAQANKNKKSVQAIFANQIPAGWAIHAVKNTSVLILSHCVENKCQKTAYYLQKNKLNSQYTLYKKQQGLKAMAMQDDIQSLNWYLVFQTNKPGIATAPQAAGVVDSHPVVAVAWKVVFVSPKKLIHQLNKPLTRIFYGYMSLHSKL